MEILLTVIGVLMVGATALPLLRSDAWWIRAFDFPRLQIAVILLLTAVGYWFMVDDLNQWRMAFLGVLVLCLLYQGTRMIRYTVFWPKQVQRTTDPDPANSISLLFANVEMVNRRSQRLKEIIREVQPDVFLALETDQWWHDQLADFAEDYPYTVFCPQENYYGMMLFSSLALVEPEIRFLIQDDIPSIHSVLLLPSGQEITLHCVHPRPPMPDPDSNPSSTERDAELLIIGRQIKETHEPAILMGDLNDVAWSYTSFLFQKISGMLDPRIGRGFYNSFHAQYPLVRFPLDHFFHSDHFRLITFKRLPAFGSDHFPMYIELSYELDAAAEQHVEEADAEEQAEAAEKVAEAKQENP